MFDDFQLSFQQQHVYNVMMSGENVALFGEAGTGKSVVVRKFLQSKSKVGDTVCLAPTGLAARNIGEAQTIHSFFSLDPGWVSGQPIKASSQLQYMLPHIRTIIIDEISMVRSDIFELIDQGLRANPITSSHHPFGGRQIIVVGDFKQLPPVVSDENIQIFLDSKYGGNYAFKTKSWHDAQFKNYHLNQIYRQDDPRYINILNQLRNNIQLQHALATFNTRVCPFFSNSDFQYSPGMALCSIRKHAAEINIRVLSTLPGMIYQNEARVRGVFPPNEYPADFNLELKVGAKVMLLANKKTPPIILTEEYDYVNGDTGIITGFDANSSAIGVLLKSGKTVLVHPYLWFNYEYALQEEDGEIKIKALPVGTFEQFPIAVAYACTIHKAQGQTLDNIHLILGRGCFVSGQLYTALSRVRRLENLSLESEIKTTDAICDPMVDDFYMKIQYEKIL